MRSRYLILTVILAATLASCAAPAPRPHTTYELLETAARNRVYYLAHPEMLSEQSERGLIR